MGKRRMGDGKVGVVTSFELGMLFLPKWQGVGNRHSHSIVLGRH
jgi:hypothetical protein